VEAQPLYLNSLLGLISFCVKRALLYSVYLVRQWVIAAVVQSGSHYNDSRMLIWRIGGLWQRDSCLICLLASDLYKILHAHIWSLVIQNFSKHSGGIRTERILNTLILGHFWLVLRYYLCSFEGRVSNLIIDSRNAENIRMRRENWRNEHFRSSSIPNFNDISMIRMWMWMALTIPQSRLSFTS